MDEGDVVGDALQVAGDVGGDQDRPLPVRNKFQENVQNLRAHHRIQAAGRLVEDQQLCVVAERHRQRELHLHAAGKFLELLFVRQSKPLEVLLIEFHVPVLVDTRHHLAQMGGKDGLVKGQLVKDHADLLAVGGGHTLVSKAGDAAAIRLAEPQNQAHGGRFARTVLADQPHDAALWQREADVL